MIRRHAVTLIVAIALVSSKSESDGLRNVDDHRAVLVDPAGRGDSTTIQGGIDLAPPGGRVRVLPGTYDEAIVIAKGLTLEGVNRRGAQAIIAASRKPNVAVQVTTSDPVAIRNMTVHAGGANGIAGTGGLHLTVERVTVLAIAPSVSGNLIAVVNNATSGPRARLVVVDSRLDGAIAVPGAGPQTFGIRANGDIDAWLVRNEVRRVGGACIVVNLRADLAGETNADIINNDLDECYPTGRVASILVGPGFPLPPGRPTARGTVNIIGNRIANSADACRPTSAISFEYFGGRIERNSIVGVVQECATDTVRNLTGAIWVGSVYGYPAVSAVVRYNDIAGNAHAGLRVASQQISAIDATCNWWGSATGPSLGLSRAGPGTGDAVVVEDGAATPRFWPFARRPVARTGRDFEDDNEVEGCGREADD